MSTPVFEAWLASAESELPGLDVGRIVRLQVAVATRLGRSPLRFEDGEVSAEWFGASVALRDPRRPAQGLYNRVIGFRPSALAYLDEWVRYYEDVGVPCQVDVAASCFTGEVRQALAQRGFGYCGAARTSVADPRTLDARGPSDVSVEDVTPDLLGEALEISRVVQGRPRVTPEDLRLRQHELAREESFFVSLARVGGEPAALASLFFQDGAAYLANAVTLPAMRRRGCQAALLAHRLREAARRGADLVATDTFVGVESQRNVERAGLRTAYSAGWWCKPRKMAT